MASASQQVAGGACSTGWATPGCLDLSNAWRRGRGKACRPRQCTLEDLPLLRNMHLRNQFSTPRTSPTMMREVLSPKGKLPHPDLV